jgi:hypothetical protein
MTGQLSTGWSRARHDASRPGPASQNIARLVGHSGTMTMETVHRKQIARCTVIYAVDPQTQEFLAELIEAMTLPAPRAPESYLAGAED